MSNLVPIDFYGDTVLVYPADQTHETSVLVRRVCENLGCDLGTQLSKLKKSAWANCWDSPTVAGDGKSRVMTMIPVRALPMWLAGIDADRVASHVREKLVRYQIECADVLATHFMPRMAEAAKAIAFDPSDPRVIIAVIEAQSAKLRALESVVSSQGEVIADLAPKADVADALALAPETMLFREAVKILHRTTAVTENEARALMIERGWIVRLNGRLQPGHYGASQGYVVSIDRPWKDADGGQHATPELRITQKGLARLSLLLTRTDAAE